MATLVRITDGLVQPDDFNRPDSNTVGNGWTEGELLASDFVIFSNSLAHNNINRVANVKRNLAAVPDAGGLPDQGTGSGSRYNPAANLMFHVNVNNLHTDTGGGPFLWGSSVWSGFDNIPDEWYHLAYSNFGSEWALYDKIASISPATKVASTPEVIPTSQWFSLRLVVEHDVEGPTATTRTLEGWGLSLIAGPEDLSSDLVLKVGPWVDVALAWVQVAPLTTHDWYGILQGFWENLWDAAFCCGTYVRIIGVPVGWSAEVDSRGPVVSVGADIIMPAKSWALPYSTLTIRDDLAVIRLQETPAPVLGWGAGGFGGDIWEIQGSFAPLDPENLACVCDPDEVVMHLTWDDVAITEDGYRVFRSEDLAGPFVQVGPDLPANTTSYDDTSVESNKRYYYYVIAFTGPDLSNPSNIVTCRTKFWTDCLGPPAGPSWTKYEGPTLCDAEFLIVEGAGPAGFLTITGVPTGYSASVDDATYYPEVSGTISIPAAAGPFPVDQVYLRDNDSVVVFIMNGPVAIDLELSYQTG